MPVLANARHERFAVEVACGLPASAAYMEAGYQDNRGNACRMKAYEDVSQRIGEIQEEKARRVNLSRADLLEMMLDDRELARRESQSAAAIRASELLGRELAGLYTERRDVTQRDATVAMSDQELHDKLAALLNDPSVSLALRHAVEVANPPLPDDERRPGVDQALLDSPLVPQA